MRHARHAAGAMRVMLAFIFAMPRFKRYIRACWRARRYAMRAAARVRRAARAFSRAQRRISRLRRRQRFYGGCHMRDAPARATPIFASHAVVMQRCCRAAMFAMLDDAYALCGARKRLRLAAAAYDADAHLLLCCQRRRWLRHACVMMRGVRRVSRTGEESLSRDKR